jgi:hypothetical protein
MDVTPKRTYKKRLFTGQPQLEVIQAQKGIKTFTSVVRQ